MDSTPAECPSREERFERIRRFVGFALAPALFVGIWFLPVPGLDEPAHRLLAVIAGIVTLWMTEALPLPVTALLGPTLCVLAGAFIPEAGTSAVKQVFRGFGDPVIFLFIGSFLLAEAMLHHGLNRRIAFQILGLPGVGRSPFRLLAAFGAITATISMWVSNTATTAMMFPIAMAILHEMARRQSERTGRETPLARMPFATGLMLLTAFAASVGGLGTPVGTPPNLIGLGLIERSLGVKISFFQWMSFGMPLAVVMVVFLILLFARTCPADAGMAGGSADWLKREKAKLGPVSRGEWNVMFAFGCTVLLWMAPGFMAVALDSRSEPVKWFDKHVPEAIAALIGALLLFGLPVRIQKWEFTLTWREAARIDWGTILLFGGGLALGDLMFSTGLAGWMGKGLAGALHAHSTFGLVALFTAVAIVLSETTSNVAAANMVVPVAIAVAQAAGVDPLPPALAACLGASMGFMLPVSTPPNAIVYGSGCIPLLKMVRHGALLDLVGFLVIVPVTTWFVPWLMKVR
ncbi:MAG: solute carrier family 13 (sodium-dependent dicarboxylate transporter), er 2/3/5 [Verrucomicrobiota bacterium]|jgi:sodium-dependent dicarboxylate transporter 2/3/5